MLDGKVHTAQLYVESIVGMGFMRRVDAAPVQRAARCRPRPSAGWRHACIGIETP